MRISNLTVSLYDRSNVIYIRALTLSFTIWDYKRSKGKKKKSQEMKLNLAKVILLYEEF